MIMTLLTVKNLVALKLSSKIDACKNCLGLGAINYCHKKFYLRRNRVFGFAPDMLMAAGKQ